MYLTPTPSTYTLIILRHPRLREHRWKYRPFATDLGDPGDPRRKFHDNCRDLLPCSAVLYIDSTCPDFVCLDGLPPGYSPSNFSQINNSNTQTRARTSLGTFFGHYVTLPTPSPIFAKLTLLRCRDTSTKTL